MNICRRLNPQRPWHSGFIATTGLTLLMFSAVQLWVAGLAEWAFVLTFFSIWCLLSLLWSNDYYIEQSNLLLASVVDQNFDRMHERLMKLESEIPLKFELPNDTTDRKV